MNERKRMWLRAGLLGLFVAAGGASLHESWQIYVLIGYASNLDQLAPHLGDVELPDEHRHALYMYPCAILALACAYGLYRTRSRSGLGGT